MGVLEFVVFFAVARVATGLNADGVALLAFRNSIWSDPHGVFRTWNSSDSTPCLWTGITCVRIQATMEDRVVSLDLPRKALAGTIAPSLGELAHLASVNLGFNKLTGQIPRELFRATGLSRLYFSNNKLTGGIPVEIRDLGLHLRVLEASGNRLSELPQEIAACYRLRRLLLSNNRIAGVIPQGIGTKITMLERLDLSVNEFSGFIPNEFGNLSSLLPQVPLNLSNNHLSGSIPASLANLRSVPIDLSNNDLSGRIPPNSYFQSQGPMAYAGNAALCGSPLKIDCIPSPSASPVASSAASESVANSRQKEEFPLSKAAVVAISVGSGIAGFMLMASFVLYFVMSLKNSPNSRVQAAESASRCLCSWRSGAPDDEYGDDEDLVHLSGVYSFNLEQLLRASAYVLGKSGEGIVYKAVLDEGSVVAVRRLGEGGEQKRKEFESEVKSIAQVRHPNVVGLHSYSWTSDEKLLVYDYLPNGSLETALHGGSQSSSKGTLPWGARMRIASGAAQGLAHLHDRKQSHGDINPGNILLDGFLEPRIAGLGVRRLESLLAQTEKSSDDAASARGREDSGGGASSLSPAPDFRSWSSLSRSPGNALRVTTKVPKAATLKRASPASDVYSFGVVLLALLSGRSPVHLLESGQLDLVSWLRFALQQKNALLEIFDPELLVHADALLHTQMIETLQVALACIAVNPDSRPKMKQVVEFFEQILVAS